MINQSLYIDPKYDLELKYQELRDTWKEEEMNNLLQLLNLLCENCFKPAQKFLREQINDSETSMNKTSGKYTSIDLIYQVASIFIEIVDQLGDFVL